MRFRLALAVLFLAALTPGYGTEPGSGHLISIEKIEATIKDIESAQELKGELKDKLLTSYKRTLGRLQTAAAHDSMAQSFKKAIETAPKELAGIQKKLAGSDARSPEDLALKDIALADLDQRLLLELANLATLKSDLGDLEKQVLAEELRPQEIREQLAKIENLDDTDKERKTASPADTPAELIEARAISRQVRQHERLREANRLGQELLSHGVRLQLLSARQDLQAREVTQAEARVKQLEEAIALRRQADAAQAETQVARIQLELASKHPSVRQAADENSGLGRELSAIVESIKQADSERKELEARAKDLKKDFTRAKKKLEIAGLTTPLGQILRDQRRQLPELSYYEDEAEKRQTTIGEVGLNQFRVDEQRGAIADINRALARMTDSESFRALTERERIEVTADLKKLLKDRHGLLDKLADAYSNYLSALGDLDFVQRQLVDTAQQYAAFLGRHLLWIPSAAAINLATLRDLGTAGVWILTPEHWVQTSETLAADLFRTPLLTLMTGLLIAGLVYLRPRLRSQLEAITEKVVKPYSDRFILTVRALLFVLILELPWPLLVWTLGWKLAGAVGAPDFARGVGTGLYSMALLLFFLRAFYRLCCKDGIADLHFHWQEHALTLLRKNIAWLSLVVVPTVYITAMVGIQDESIYRDSLGRIAFITCMLAVTVFIQRVLRLDNGALTSILTADPKGWTARLRYIWYPAAIGVPLVLAGLAIIGYYDTALELESQLVSTVWLLAGAVIGHDLVIRWMTLENRKLALVKAKEKREAVRSGNTERFAIPVDGGTLAIESDDIDIPTINHQTRHLLRTLIFLSSIVGCWLIWSPVLPALAILDQVSLWETQAIVDGQEVQQPVTLANLGLAIVLTIVTVVASRNLPGVLEIAVLRHFSINAGSRYAITHVMTYVIVALGTITVFHTIGGRWAQVQWLVAALGVGLGFGLQEIFANFISGLIILLERPIRVGDIVTVGDMTGTVSRIRIRATTITDGDRRELVIPNKTFITDRLVNWTLSDTITRVVMRVGIAYGSDTALAHRVILEAIKSLPLVLRDPEPSVFFVGLGDSSLDFEVGVFVRELNDRMPLTHEFHMCIERALKDHNISIPYPQRDVHVWFMGANEAQAVKLQTAPQEAPRVTGVSHHK
ncbi:MAG: mechanosensitive ion channel domain-containing protein [Gammaproteobacteria bacterium]